MGASTLLQHIDETTDNGAAVVSAPIDQVVELVRNLILSGRSSTVYLSRPQAERVRRLYWRPEVVERTGVTPLADGERERIARVLGIEIEGPVTCNQIDCGCGGSYTLFDFLEEGIRTHGRKTVEGVFALRNTCVLQVNPRQSLTCTDCGSALDVSSGGIEYDATSYACCYQDSCW